MNIYLVSQTENDEHDTYESFVCYAKNETFAANFNPLGESYGTDESEDWGRCWCSSPVKADVRYLGIGTYDSFVPVGTCEDGRIICKSFNAG